MEKVACRAPKLGREGTTNIPAWKFDLMQTAIRAALAVGPLGLAALQDAVTARMPDEQQVRLGSVSWHMTTVRLEMEARGVLVRNRRGGRLVVGLAPGG